MRGGTTLLSMMALADDKERVWKATPSEVTARFCLVCAWPIDELDRCRRECRMNEVRINGTEPERSN